MSTASFPAVWQPLLEELNLQYSFMDQFSAAWVSDYRSGGGEIYCGRGCSRCCSLAVNCTLTEAVRLASSLDQQQANVVGEYVERLKGEAAGCGDLKSYLSMQRTVMGACPLLDNANACSVYGTRPLSCRALHSTKESHWCGVDFSGMNSDEKREYVESLDRSVVAFPLHYVASLQETGSELEGRCLAVMEKSFGFSLYGSMPVLVHLVRDHGLVELVGSGRMAVEAYVAERGLDHPYLLTFSS